MEVESTFTFFGDHQRIHDSGPLYNDGDYANEAVVPFSWEKKPGVPLMLSPNNNLENIKGRELVCEFCSHGEVMLNPNNVKDVLCRKHHEEKATTILYRKHHEEKATTIPPLLLQSSMPNHMLFPLPKPPSCANGIQNSTSNMSTNMNSSNPSSIPFTPKKHTHSRQKFGSYLNKEQDKNTTFYMSKANIIKDDPFLKAIQACTEIKEKAREENRKSTSITIVQHDVCVPRGGGKEAQGAISHSKSKYTSTCTTEPKIMIKARDSNHKSTKAKESQKTAACNVMSYNGHPAFMVASFHGHPPPATAAYKLQKNTLSKPHLQARPHHHQRSPSYGGCLGCSTADNYDSIVRI